jgi:hypothetical protein
LDVDEEKRLRLEGEDGSVEGKREGGKEGSISSDRCHDLT